MNKYANAIGRPDQLATLKTFCEHSHLGFTRYFFKMREAAPFIKGPHHRLICHTLDRVISGEISRLIINVPPGYTKTELAVIHFIARGLSLNPRSKFIHLSYSDDLALLNSGTAKNLVTSDEYQALWPLLLKTDTHSKKRWYTTDGGGVMAASAGGQVTGFRAGKMEPGWSGALIVDDPIKPEDAYSDTKRAAINRQFNTTAKNRIALESTPIIIIMQRVHEDDLTGWNLRGGSGYVWDHLSLPVDGVREQYPDDYTHGRPVDHNLPEAPLWPAKHNERDLDMLKEADPYTYSAQYLQRPAPLGGGVLKHDWLEHWYEGYDPVQNVLTVDKGPPPLSMVYKCLFADTAMKTGQLNDFSVAQVWGYGSDDRIYLMDMIRGKWEAHELRAQLLAFCERHEFKHLVNQIGLRSRYVEDKASGTGLIQEINNIKGGAYLEGIPRDKDKVSRMMGAVPQFAQGKVVLPRNAPWISDYLYELRSFNAMMTHRHDDQVDATLDAVDVMLLDRPGLGGFVPYRMGL